MSNYFEKLPKTSRHVEMSAALSVFSVFLGRCDRENVQLMQLREMKEKGSSSKVVGVMIRVKTPSYLR